MYEKFKTIDGSHPWREVSPNGYIDYPVCYRANGSVAYFNFPLAKELNLIPSKHPCSMNSVLENIILRTFSLQIVNEYDQQYKTKRYQNRIPNRMYMATRYIQLQHQSRTGKTSGDGRSIWNGIVKTRNKLYDVSSCGTGVTQLSPGSQLTEGLIKTGNNEFGYSDGLADIHEGFTSATMSEIFYQRNIPTERVLAIISFKNNNAIIVRATPNLIRPAHIFRYLKAEQKEDLASSIHYYIDRQIRNGDLNTTYKEKKLLYKDFLQDLVTRYAIFSAKLEREYIFSWFAWDGDNVLAYAALLDYGSIRQFAARHDKYQFDDEDRLSTTLSEQKYWCKKTVQYFIQAIDFLLKGSKQPIESFDKHPLLREFEKTFNFEMKRHLLYQLGFDDDNVHYLMKKKKKLVNDFIKVFSYFEKIKTINNEVKVADGIDHRPVFILRDILRELPNELHNKIIPLDSEKKPMTPELFCDCMAGSYVHKKDLLLSENRIRECNHFQEIYKELINVCPLDNNKLIKKIIENASVINYKFRFTGDGIIIIVKLLVKAKQKLSKNKFQSLITRFIESQILIPKQWKPLESKELDKQTQVSKYLKKINKILQDYHELI